MLIIIIMHINYF